MPRTYETAVRLECDNCGASAEAKQAGASGQKALAAALHSLRSDGWGLGANNKGLTTCPTCSNPQAPESSTPSATQHTCSVCGRSGPWFDSWQHYGSIRIDEACGCRVVTCSGECREHSRAAELVAGFEARHRYGRKGCA